MRNFIGVSRPPSLTLFCIRNCYIDVYFPNNPSAPPPDLKVQGRILGNTINTFSILLSEASSSLTHYRGKKKYELCLLSQYFSGQTFEQIKATLKDEKARSHLPGCLPNGASVDECKILWDCIFRFDQCSETSYWDGPLRKAHVKKTLKRSSRTSDMT